jgi:uncharacterized protein (TIGR03086 family)
MTAATTSFDLGPAAAAVKALIPGVRDEQLTGPTPCAETPVAQLLDHLLGLAVAFRLAAEKVTNEITASPPRASGDHLHPAWRTELPARLDALVAAWREPAAWVGDAQAGGATFPAPVMARFGLDELVLHGWDLARATGQPYAPDDAVVAACLPLFPEEQTGGVPGMFGPRVDVPADAPLLDRLVAASGRRPDWRP